MDKSEPRVPQKSKNASISVHTQTKPIESKKSVASTQTIEVQASSSVASQFEKKEENAAAPSIDYKDQSDQKGQSIVSEQKE